MPTITFTLSDFGMASLAPYAPEVIFVPSGPGVKDGALFSSTPVTVIPDAAGAGSVTLAATDGVTPEVWFTVKIRHLMPGGQYTNLDLLDWRIYVPDAYVGPIGGLPGTPLSPVNVYTNLLPPSPGFRGWWLYSPNLALGQEMPLDDPLIGELRIVS